MIALSDVVPGLTAIVAAVLSAPARRDRLAALGLVRGAAVRLVQRRPALIVGIDGTEIAIDVAIGVEVMVVMVDR